MTRVIGVDLSLSRTGLALPDGVTESIPWRIGAPKTYFEQSDRIVYIAYQVERAFTSSLPDVVLLEGPAYGTNVGAAHERAGLWWRVYDRAQKHNIPVAVVPPANVKRYATGSGSADKDVVLANAIRRLGFPGTSNDEADAWVLRAMGLDHYDDVVAVPNTHRNALDKVEWPQIGEK